MKRRLTASFVLLVVTLLTASLVPVAAVQPEARALIKIEVRGPRDLVSVEAAGVPVYARLTAGKGSYLLAGADPRQIEALQAAGLEGTVLDPDLKGAGYYLAYLMPGRPTPDWNAYGRLLLDDGVQVLLRTTPRQAGWLAEAGVELAAVTFDPKPLRPAPVTSALPEVVEPDPLIQQMIDQVNQGLVYNYTGGLSGEWPVNIGGSPYTIYTRNTYSGTPIQKATQYVGEHLANLGLAVEYHQWGGVTYPNVIGTITGTLNPDDIFIIGAHLDDMPSSGNAPGADDNASGSVATLIAADILSQYEWGCTLRFAFWTGEEQGLNGSHAYAQRAYSRGENIVGYLNLDMIAWNSGGSSPDIDLHADSSLPPTLVLAQLFADVVDAYDLNLIPQIIPNGTGASDHASFWDYGYTAILGIEDMGDFNPYYHTVNDDMDNFQDWPYYVEFVKAAIATYAHMTGCLIPGGIGALDGHVTAASGGAPIADATVTAEDDAGHTFPATTDSSGYYTRTLLAGTYTVTAEAYGYLPATVGGVVVTTDTVTTQDFALQTAPTYIVSGTVTEQGSGTPLFAEIRFQGSPVVVWTDPATGFYQATLPQGSYTMQVSAYGHRSQERAVVVDHNQTQDFALEPLPCILLVDDDNNSPDVRPYFTAALDNLGYDYDVFDVGSGSGNGPDLAGLQGYSIVIWFSGDKYGDSAGPNSADETALAAYLDGGGRLFLSSQNYLYDFGLTAFGQNYLGIGSYTNDSGNASTKYGVPGDPIGGGLGPYPLTYPAGFSDYGDIVNAGAGASVAFRSQANGGNNLDVDKAGGSWKTVFFGTDWVPIYNNNAANGRQVLQRIIQWFGDCQPQVGWLVGRVTDAVSGAPLVGATVLAQSQSGSIQALTDPNGRYTMTLPADTYDVTASMTGYVSQTAPGVEVQAGMTVTQDFALEPVPGIVVSPPALEAALYADQVETQTLWITNTGAAPLDFWLHEMSRTLALAAGPAPRPRTEPVVDAAVWDQVWAEGQARAIIYLRELADLRPAYALRDQAERGRFVYERLQQTAERSGGELRALLEAAGAEPRPLLTANAIAATLDAPLLERVAARPEVAHVGADAVLLIPSFTPGEEEAASEAVEWNIARIRADEVWDTFGVTGQGVTVGNIGTGGMYDHTALVGQYRGNLGGGTFDHNYNWFDLVNGQTTPYDDNGHSTFGIGLVVGDDGGINQIGVAPGAKWIAVKACNATGNCSLSDLHAGFQWLLAPTDLSGADPDPARRPHIGLNMWGSGGCNSEFQPDLLAWQAAGILPVFAPGGSGPGCGTVSSPAALAQAVSAGATDSSDQIAPFSSRGPSPCDGQIKPEVAAPGVNIRSSYVDGGYQVWSGTSLSAAHLAGAAALVLSANLNLDPEEIKEIVEGTALCLEDLSCGGTPCPDGANNVYGWGRIDAFEAVSLTLSGLEYDLPWLSETPQSGTLGPGERISIAVTFDASGLEPGVYLGLLDAESTDPATPHLGVPVTLTVLTPCDPVEILALITDTQGCTVTFRAELSGTPPYVYEWDLGPLGSSTAPTVTVNFGVSGSYPYTLTVSNCEGASTDTLTGTVTVECEGACLPVEILTVTHEITACTVTFGAGLTGTGPFTFAWDFGSFGGSAEPSPVVDFGLDGTYPYTLAVWNCGGACSDMMSGTVTVECAPAERFYFYLPLILREGP